MKIHILRKYYNLCTQILNKELQTIPTMNITNAKKYNGQITVKETKQGEILTIQLSKFNLGTGFGWDNDDIDFAIQVICHELAHITHRNHSAKHTLLTIEYASKVANELDLKNSIYYTKDMEKIA